MHLHLLRASLLAGSANPQSLLHCSCQDLIVQIHLIELALSCSPLTAKLLFANFLFANCVLMLTDLKGTGTASCLQTSFFGYKGQQNLKLPSRPCNLFIRTTIGSKSSYSGAHAPDRHKGEEGNHGLCSLPLWTHSIKAADGKCKYFTVGIKN